LSPDRAGPAVAATADLQRVAILNGFGRTIGDSVIGLQALHAALTLGALAPMPVLYRLSGFAPLVEATHRAAADFCDIRDLPWRFALREQDFPDAGRFAGCIDIRDFAFDPNFRGVAMIDYFLAALGLDPAAVSPALRRNAWLAPRVRPVRPDIAPGYVLVAPKSSMPMRDMPDDIHAYVVARLREIAPVATQGAAASDQTGVVGLRPVETLDALCGLVAHARLVVSTDTAIVHLADAFDVPCLAFFPTHDPALRVRDYPRCRAVALRARLPEGLEFARDEADVAAAHAAWFPGGSGLGWLDAELAAAWRMTG